MSLNDEWTAKLERLKLERAGQQKKKKRRIIGRNNS